MVVHLTKEYKRTWLIVAGFFLAFTNMQISTMMTEADRAGKSFNLLHAVILEYSSFFIIMLLYLPTLLFYKFLTQRPYPLWQLVAYCFLASLIYSGLHTLSLILSRKLIFFLFLDQYYVYFRNVTQDLLFEYRKDVLGFSIILGGLYLTDYIGRQKIQLKAVSEAAKGKKLAFRSGATQVFFRSNDLTFARAAGNYVEVVAGDQNHLIRISVKGFLTALTEQGVEAVQIHRSYVVNPEKITEIRPKRDGDVVLVLSNGDKIPGSRRFREAFEGLLS